MGSRHGGARTCRYVSTPEGLTVHEMNSDKGNMNNDDDDNKEDGDDDHNGNGDNYKGKDEKDNDDELVV